VVAGDDDEGVLEAVEPAAGALILVNILMLDEVAGYDDDVGLEFVGFKENEFGQVGAEGAAGVDVRDMEDGVHRGNQWFKD